MNDALTFAVNWEGLAVATRGQGWPHKSTRSIGQSHVTGLPHVQSRAALVQMSATSYISTRQAVSLNADSWREASTCRHPGQNIVMNVTRLPCCTVFDQEAAVAQAV